MINLSWGSIPVTPTSILNRADSLQKVGSFAEAFELLANMQLSYLDSLDFENQSETANRMGQIKDQLGEHSRALDLFRESLTYALLSEDPVTIADAMNSIGVSHYHNDNLDSASQYFNLSSELFKETGELRRLAFAEFNRGSMFVANEDYEKAIEHYSASVEINEELADTVLAVSTSINLGIIYLNSGYYDSSIHYLSSAHTQAASLGLKQQELAAILNLGHAYYNSERFKEASDTYEIYHAIKDSVYSHETQIEINRLNEEYLLSKEKLEKNKAELESLRWQRFSIIGISILLILIVLGVGYSRARMKIQKARTQAIVATREDENKRITDLLWKEIGVSSQDKKLSFPGQELPEHTIPGAIAAARFLSNQQFNPYLQLGLDRALEHLLINLTSGKNIQTKHEMSSIKLEKSRKLAVYRAIENILVELCSDRNSTDLDIELKENTDQLHFAVTVGHLLNPAQIRFKSAEARINSLKGKLKIEIAKNRITVIVPIEE